MMNHYPIMVTIENKPCLIVGGGKVAYRKIKKILEYKAKVNLISREVNEDIQRLIDEEQIIYLGKDYNSTLLEKVFLVIAATNNKELNKKILQDCNEANILINSVDNPKESSFIQPSKIEKGNITIAISTEGKSPILSKIIRNKVENIIDDSYGEYLELLGEFRTQALEKINNETKRKEFFVRITREEYLNAIKEFGREYVFKEINEILAEYIVAD